MSEGEASSNDAGAARTRRRRMRGGATSADALGVVALGAHRLEDRLHVGGAARLHDDLDLDALDRERGEGALVLHLVDVGAEAGEQRRDVGERAGDVADVDAQPRPAGPT